MQPQHVRILTLSSIPSYSRSVYYTLTKNAFQKGDLPPSLSHLFLIGSYSSIDTLDVSLPSLFSPSSLSLTSSISHWMTSLLPSHLSLLEECIICPSLLFLLLFPPSLLETSLISLLTTFLLLLSSITFGYYFNRPVNHLPPTLKRLHFGYNFNQPVNCLPPSLTVLHCGFLFNQFVDFLPLTLKKFSLGTCFTNKVDRLPPSLTHLIISNSRFNHPIDHLPSTLLHLKVDHSFQLSHSKPSLLFNSIRTGWVICTPTYSSPSWFDWINSNKHEANTT